MCQALTLSDALGVWNGDANSEKRTPEQSPSISVRQPSRARVRVTCQWCWRSIISDAPRCPHCSQIDGGLMRGAIHEPDNALPSRAVLPKNVRLTVPVKVARTSHAPRCRHGSQTHNGGTRRAIHEPDNALASRAVLPKNVRFAVPAKVARTRDAPRCRHESQTHSGGTRGAVHEPDNALASRTVLPKNVCLTVGVEIALHGQRHD